MEILATKVYLIKYHKYAYSKTATSPFFLEFGADNDVSLLHIQCKRQVANLVDVVWG